MNRLRDRDAIQKSLVISAVFFALLLCGELIQMGYFRFHDILVEGKADYIYFKNPAIHLRLSLYYLILNIIYLIWLFRLHQEPSQENWHNFNFLEILKTRWIFLTLAFLGYPLGTDIYSYLHYGVMNLNGFNPYTHAPSDFTSAFTPWLHWDLPSPYGVFSLVFFTFSACFVKINIFLGIYVLKLIFLLVHLGNTYLIWRLISHNQHRDTIAIAYLINPVILFEQVASAHVDIFVCTSLILLIGCLKYRQYLMVNIAIWMGFLAKSLPIVWLPLIIIFMLRKQQWRNLIATFVLLLVGIGILSLTWLPNSEAWESLIGAGVEKAHASIHGILKVFLDKVYDFSPILIQRSQQQYIVEEFTKITTIGFAIYYFWTASKIYFKRHYSEANLIADISWVGLALILFTRAWLNPWYASLLLPTAALGIALCKNPQLLVLVNLSFGFWASLYYLPLSPTPRSILIILPILILGLGIAGKLPKLPTQPEGKCLKAVQFPSK